MSSSTPSSSLPPIHAANGNCMFICHVGTMITPTLNFPKTYHVLNLTFNLAFVGQLCDLGLIVSFSSNGCQVQDPHTGHIVGKGRKVGRLFELTSFQILTSPSISTSVVDPAIYQWHLCLGHVSSENLRKLVSFGNLTNISKFDSFDRLNCKLAKQPGLSFLTSSSSCNTPFGLIHSDIWGPASTPTVNGYCYFVLFIDDYSRFTWIYFLTPVFLTSSVHCLC